MYKNKLCVICLIMIVVTVFLSGCTSEVEFYLKQNDMIYKTKILSVFSFTGAPKPKAAKENILWYDTVYDTLEIFPNEEEAEKKYKLWTETKGTIYAVPTELTFAKIDYVNEILEFDGRVEAMKEKGYSYPLTINDFVDDIDKLRTFFSDTHIVRSTLFDKVISFGEAYDYKKRKELFGTD